MNKLARQLLRVAILVLLLGSVLAQVLVPVFATEQGRIFSEVAHLVVPYSLAGILLIAFGQAALLAIWRLLSLVNRGAIFTHRALRWVDVITVCGALATVLSAGVMIHLLAFVRVGGPGVFFGLAASVAGGTAFVLLMVVMRGLLEAAISDRAELDEVI
jgi:hypothetical protein